MRSADKVHYLVTTRFWRGLWGAFMPDDRTICRACDWHPATPAQVLHYQARMAGDEFCDDCVAYVEALRRMRQLPGQRLRPRRRVVT